MKAIQGISTLLAVRFFSKIQKTKGNQNKKSVLTENETLNLIAQDRKRTRAGVYTVRYIH